MRRAEIVMPVIPVSVARWDRGPRREGDRSNRNQAIASLQYECRGIGKSRHCHRS